MSLKHMWKRPVSVRACPFESLFVRPCSHTPHFLNYMSGHLLVIGGDEERKKRKKKGGPKWAVYYMKY